MPVPGSVSVLSGVKFDNRFLMVAAQNRLFRAARASKRHPHSSGR
jgi:hypothetical protein